MKKVIFPIIFLVTFACSKKEETQTQSAGKAEMANHPAGLAWQAPAGWEEEPPANPMRKAQFTIPKAEGDSENASVVVIHFPGQGAVGGVEANLKRWYGQFKQPDGSPTSESAIVSDKQINNLSVKTVKLAGTYLYKTNMMSPNAIEKPNFKMLAAIVSSSAGPYFIKCVGPEKTISKWADSFDEFLQSLTE